MNQASTTSAPKKYPLTRKLIENYTVARIFDSCQDQINGASFSNTNHLLITSCNDKVLRLYRVELGDQCQNFSSKKYGCGNVRFTHSDSSVIYTSTTPGEGIAPHGIRYLSLHSYQYLMYFMGHTNTVTSLEMSATDDQFISCSRDKTVKLWDLKSQKPVANINTPFGNAVANFDHSGSIFAVGCPQVFQGTYCNAVQLYNRASLKAPFSTFLLPTPPSKPGAIASTPSPSASPHSPTSPIESSNQTDNSSVPPVISSLPVLTNIQFSIDGSLIIVSTNTNAIYVMDAYNGQMKGILQNFPNPSNQSFIPTLSPDSQFLVSPGEDRGIHVWSLKDLSKIGTLHGHPKQKEPPLLALWSRKTMMFVTCAREMYWWLPPANKLST